MSWYIGLVNDPDWAHYFGATGLDGEEISWLFHRWLFSQAWDDQIASINEKPARASVQRCSK
jgi:hypothetical protein